jgi:hypothetical protein
VVSIRAGGRSTDCRDIPAITQEDTMKMTRVSLLLAIVATATAVTAAAKPAGKFLQLPADELKWEEFYPGGPVESFIVGSKEAKHGPTAFFIKFKPGFVTAMTRHSRDSKFTAPIRLQP